MNFSWERGKMTMLPLVPPVISSFLFFLFSILSSQWSFGWRRNSGNAHWCSRDGASCESIGVERDKSWCATQDPPRRRTPWVALPEVLTPIDVRCEPCRPPPVALPELSTPTIRRWPPWTALPEHPASGPCWSPPAGLPELPTIIGHC
jgi:hypothetical protein